MKYLNSIIKKESLKINNEPKVESNENVKRNLREELRTNVERMIGSHKRSLGIKTIYNVIEEMMLSKLMITKINELIEFDEETYVHSVNVTALALIVGYSIGLNNNDLYELGLGAILHDIGKTLIPRNVLNKNGKLSDEEYNLVKEHSSLGYELIKDSREIPYRSKLIVLEHHERVDGSGYPTNMVKDEANDFSRLIAICDVYEALTTKRSYKEPWLPSDAIEYIMSESSILFDINYVRFFAQNVSIYPSGSLVNICSSNEDYIVIKCNPGMPARPIIKSVSSNLTFNLASRENLNKVVCNVV